MAGKDLQKDSDVDDAASAEETVRETVLRLSVQLLYASNMKCERLLQRRSEKHVRRGKTVVVGWAYERPSNGRAYATTLVHFYRNYQLEAFLRTIVNAILWTAHVEVPPNGAPVDLSEDDLTLPLQPEKK